jgi:hypothetical protein
VVVTFNYVFTGCYALEIAAEGPHHVYTSNILKPMFIETGYKKDLLIDKKPSIILQSNPVL